MSTYTEQANPAPMTAEVYKDIKDFLFSIVKPVPHDLVIPVPVFSQFQPESLFFDVLVEPLRQFIGDFP